jgi:PAS domain S-box-containing protein
MTADALSRLHRLLANRELRALLKTHTRDPADPGDPGQASAAEREQVLDLLISSYEQAVALNDELRARADALARALDGERAERRRTEDELRASEQLFRGVFNARTDAVLVTTPERTVANMNPAAEAMFGYTLDELRGRSTEVFHVDREHYLKVAQSFQAAFGGGNASFAFEMKRKSGEVFRTEQTISQLTDDVGQPKGTVGVIRDITERERAERERTRLVAILEATPDLVAMADLEGRTLYLNAGGRRLLGLGAQAISSLRIADFHPPALQRTVWETAIPSAVRDGSWRGETTFLARDGREIPVAQVILAHKTPGGRLEYLSTVARDLSEHKRLEAQGRQVMKLEAIGLLAGGVAHDFNNILGVITGYADVLASRLPPADPLRRHTQEIAKAAQRAAGLTRQLLAFSRKQALHPRPLDLNATIQGMEGTLRRVLGEEIEMVMRLAPAVPLVMADPGQVEQVLVNLAGNARDAMPVGGRLTVETAETDLGEPDARALGDVRPGAYTTLSVSDTGHGMDEATRSHVFEPFFTTKELGKGTGLGLSTIYGVVKQSGGHVSVHSVPDRGTTFTIHLPQVGAVTGAAAPDAAIPAEPPGGAETVLVVEDEEALRELVSEVLEEKGYRILLAPDGAEALSIAAAHAGPIHLLLTDVMMPRLNGHALFQRLAALRPGLRCIFMSGFTGHATAGNEPLPEGQGFLDKPFTTGALLWKVREALDAPPPG